MARMRYALWVLPAIGLVLATVAFTARRGGVVAWLRAMPQVDTVQAELESQRENRDALWGNTEDGSAFVHYADAMSHVCALAERGGTVWRRELTKALALEGGSLENARELLADPLARLSLEALTRGAHAEDGSLRVDWARPQDPLPSLLGAADVERVAFVKALVLMEAGEDLASVHVLLDALQFGADLAEAPIGFAEIIGTHILGSGRVETLVSLRGWGQLDPAARNVLTAGLRQLDERVSFSGSGDAGEFVTLSRLLERAFQSEEAIDFAGVDVDRALGSQFVQMRARQLQQIEWALALSAADGITAARSFADGNAKSDNAILRHPAFSRDSLGQRLGHITRLRATLAALVALQGSNDPEVRDPLDFAYTVVITERDVRVSGTDPDVDEMSISVLR